MNERKGVLFHVSVHVHVVFTLQPPGNVQREWVLSRSKPSALSISLARENVNHNAAYCRFKETYRRNK